MKVAELVEAIYGPYKSFRVQYGTLEEEHLLVQMSAIPLVRWASSLPGSGGWSAVPTVVSFMLFEADSIKATQKIPLYAAWPCAGIGSALGC